jgi:hypothetical protein
MPARILDVTPDEYHALPDFSSSIAKVVIAQSPAHAKAAVGKKPTKVMDRGAVIHRLLLGKGADYEVIRHNDFKTNKAKEERDAARAAGKVPVIAHDFESWCIAAEAIRVQLADRGIVLDGASELAIGWDEMTPHGIVSCRGMLDHAWIDTGEIIDIKLTGDAAPSAIERTAENLNYCVQWAAYTRAMTALRPELAGRVRFTFAWCEDQEPWIVNLTEPDGVFRELGERRWLRAVNTWAKCLATGVYPAYGTEVNRLGPPSWALAKEGFTADER